MKTHVALSLIAFALTLCSCSERNEFAAYHTFGGEGWAYGDTIKYVATLADQKASGTLNVEVRHDNEYLFQNLWVEVTYESDCRLKRDTVNIVMSDKFGHWTGSGFGSRYQVGAEVRGGVTLSDSSVVCIRHIMRVDTLRHIEEIGISFHPDKK